MVPALPVLFYFDHVVSAGISILVWTLSVLYFDHVVSAGISTLFGYCLCSTLMLSMLIFLL